MKAIDADALMEIYADRMSVVADRYSPDSSECGILSGAMKLLSVQSTIEPQPQRKKGKWIVKDDHLPSTESDKISYAVICNKFPNPHVYFNTYDEAEHWARFNQPNYRPYYIVERSEHFEIVGEVR